jgi:hypothetical protein
MFRPFTLARVMGFAPRYKKRLKKGIKPTIGDKNTQKVMRVERVKRVERVES